MVEFSTVIIYCQIYQPYKISTIAQIQRQRQSESSLHLHYRVTQETCDLWDIWSDRFLEDFHFSKIFRCLRDNNSNKDNPRTCDTSDADYNSDNWEPELRNSASSFHWLSSSIFSVCCLFVVRPASVTPPLIFTLWRFWPYKLYIFCEDMILATCQCHSLLSWAQSTVVWIHDNLCYPVSH